MTIQRKDCKIRKIQDKTKPILHAKYMIRKLKKKNKIQHIGNTLLKDASTEIKSK